MVAQVDFFLATTLHMWDVMMRFDGFQCRLAGIRGVGTQVLMSALRRRFTLDLNVIQYVIQLRHVMPMRAGYDE